MNSELNFNQELEGAIAGASSSRRSEMVRKVTDLFVSKADELSSDDIAIFDDVIVRLAVEIEHHAKALLGRRLAPLRNAPPQIVRLLAFDDSIEVAGPILAQNARLDDKTLVEVARKKGQAHMLAISQRAALSESVTDVLVELGDREVVLNVLDNYGASFSDRGFALLVTRSESDDTLAEFVGLRSDIPAPLLATLVAKASHAVRVKLEASHPQAKIAVRRAIAEAAGRVEAQVLSTALDYSGAEAVIENLRRAGQLNESALVGFAKTGLYAETIVALATMCNMPRSFVEQAMGRDRSETLMVLVKSIGLSWSTAQDILMLRAERGIISGTEIVQRLARFERLHTATAQEIVRVLRERGQQK